MDKKPAKKKSAKRRMPSSKDSIVNLKKKIAAQAREIRAGVEQQTATSEILRMIARAPADLQAVMDTIAENAARVCDAVDAVVWRIDGDVRHVAAYFGTIPMRQVQEEGDELGRSTTVGWAVLDRRTIHVHDLQAAQADFPLSKTRGIASGMRTVLVTPLLRDGTGIGAIHIRRREVRPFTDSQIKLLETFADQAVIAIENVRLIHEQQASNRDLTEALQQQIATSEILRVIASSPTDIQPVLDAVAESAARLCESYDAQIFRLENDVVHRVASYGPLLIAMERTPLNRQSPAGRAMVDRQAIHVHDIAAEIDSEYPEIKSYQQQIGHRTTLAAPLMREGAPIGAILIRRLEVRPFTNKQIALLKTFADQAVIAIENVRLFQELQARNRDVTEALEQQTATGEVLRVIASSPTDLQPVLDTLIANAAKLCGATMGHVRQYDGEFHRVVAHYGESPEMMTALRENPLPPGPKIPAGQALLEGKSVQILDVQSDPRAHLALARSIGKRTLLMVPLLREGKPIGSLTIWRNFVESFTDRQIELVKIFADQAVIAIENVRLFQELQTRNRELTEALEQQTATSEILRVIASSPTDIQPVLDAVAENAARLCEATNAIIFRVDVDLFKPVASFGLLPVFERNAVRPLIRGYFVGRAMLDRDVVHIQDVNSPDVQTEFPESASFAQQADVRAALATPLIREGVAIGAILIRRTEVRPFSEKQIALLKTFADQAVIAIENVRLFQELQARNAELREALEHQTATSEVLGIISRSPTDVQPVLDAIVESAARVCGIDDVVLRLIEGNAMVPRAHFGPIPLGRAEISIDEPHFRWMSEHGTLHIPDVRTQNDFPTLGSIGGWRTLLNAPLRHQGELVGLLNARRTEPRPFTPAQIKLLETFADQAVIAIENVRLFNELKESLEQQTATSEILGVIASSPTDVQPVLNAVAATAARLCDARDVLIDRVVGDVLEHVAVYGAMPVAGSQRPFTRGTPAGRAVIESQTIHIHDVVPLLETEFPEAKARQQTTGTRTVLVTPLLRERIPIGTIQIRRTEVRPFSEKQVGLLKTFAAQAVIAIENVRLFQELKESLEQQTATSEILGVIASSPTDIQPVLDVVAENAARLCEATDAQVQRVDGDVFMTVASYGPFPPTHEKRALDRTYPPGRAIIDRKIIHITDLEAIRPTEFPGARGGRRPGGNPLVFRTVLAVPLLREETAIGSILIRRTEVKPFTDKQVALLETFASQAVIAIENVRLFKELQERNAELREALEHQTATAEVLSIISRSPTDVQPVLDAIVESAAKVCGIDDVVLRLREGNNLVSRAHFGPIPVPANRIQIDIDAPQYRWIREHGTLHVPNISEWNDFQLVRAPSWRSRMTAPLRQQGEIVGVLNARRIEVRPFTPVQIKLLETFADQAVIAIENVRLFNELKEALEQQTATSEILGVIASSPTDLQPILDVIVRNAARVCGAENSTIFMATGNVMRVVAVHGTAPGSPMGFEAPIERASVSGRALIDRRTVHVPDLAEALSEFSGSRGVQRGYRSLLSTPLFREGIPIGTISVRRMEVKPFTEKQIQLLETFANQAVIAIENVRLFQELEARTQELARSVGELKALGEVGHAVSSTLDLPTVLSTIVARAVQLSGTDCGVIYEYDEAAEVFNLRASYRMEEELVEAIRAAPLRVGEGYTGQAALARAPVQVGDLREEQEVRLTRIRPISDRLGYRSLLGADPA